MIKNKITHFFQNSFQVVRFLSRDKETLPQLDLRNGKDLNNQSLWKDRHIYVDVFKLFCLIRRNRAY